MGEQLKPCPFCGSEAEISKSVGALEVFLAVFCSNVGCPASPDTGYLVGDAAIRQWNTRPESDPVKDKLAEALTDVLTWAGKDKRRMARRGWTLEKEMASLNRAYAVLNEYDKERDTGEEQA